VRASFGLHTICALAFVAGCGGSPRETTSAPPAAARRTPPSSIEGDVQPGVYAFPGLPLRTADDGFYGHVIGLAPLELLGPVEDGYRVAIDIAGTRIEAQVQALTPVVPHTCARAAITMANGALRADVAPGGVVQVRAMDAAWAEVSVGMGLSAIVAREQLGLDACVEGNDSAVEGDAEVPRYGATYLACLFPTNRPDDHTRALEVIEGTPMEVLETEPGWRRVRVRHGAVTYVGWLAAPRDLPPDRRPPLPAPREETPPTCRRTTRALELGDEERVLAPAGTYAGDEYAWIPIGARGFLQMEAQPPPDVLGPEEPCFPPVWEPWEGYMGECFYPGLELEHTDVDPRVSYRSGGAPQMLEPLRAIRSELVQCARGEGTVAVDLAVEPGGAIPRATIVREETTRPEAEARCVADRLKRLVVEAGRSAAVVRVTVPFFAP
jgi:hypothetical protein